jgi:hypothetical protein
MSLTKSAEKESDVFIFARSSTWAFTKFYTSFLPTRISTYFFNLSISSACALENVSKHQNIVGTIRCLPPAKNQTVTCSYLSFFLPKNPQKYRSFLGWLQYPWNDAIYLLSKTAQNAGDRLMLYLHRFYDPIIKIEYDTAHVLFQTIEDTAMRFCSARPRSLTSFETGHLLFMTEIVSQTWNI